MRVVAKALVRGGFLAVFGGLVWLAYGAPWWAAAGIVLLGVVAFAAGLRVSRRFEPNPEDLADRRFPPYWV